MQTAIPCLLMRGGTSKGPFFRATDLPSDLPTRDRVLLAAMGSPDKRQIDGVGGAHPLTSKVGIVSLSDKEGIDLEFLFAQLQPDKDTVDTTPNCGNMLAGVVPFALETGMVSSRGETSTFRVLTLNTGMAADITGADARRPGGVRRLGPHRRRARQLGTHRDQLSGHGRLGLLGPAAHGQAPGHGHGDGRGFRALHA